MSPVSIGARRHRFSLTIPGTEVPDGMGGFTPGVPTVKSPIYGEIIAASARNAERILPQVVIASASHLVTVPYVSGVTLQSSLVFHDPLEGDKTFAITYVDDWEQRHEELRLACEEAK